MILLLIKCIHKKYPMPFCEECGAKLSPGVRFCEQCGTPVPAPTVFKQEIDSLDTFVDSEWSKKWNLVAKDCRGHELGLIVTNLSALAKQLVCSEMQLRLTINDYILAANRRGVLYHFLDLNHNEVDCADCHETSSVVDVIRQVVNVAKPKYLFILGNEEIVAVQTWENEVPNDDECVDADLPYATLDTQSPWQGLSYDYDKIMRVGRLPSYAGESFEAFTSYFENAKIFAGNMGDACTYGLTALTWEDASNGIYRQLNSDDVLTSPEMTVDHVLRTIPENANLFYFNLHGGASKSQKEWYGESISPHGYPKAISPEVVKSFKAPYIIGVEACYGARYIDGLTPETSILLTAMQSGCLAMLGSSKIAYGMPNAPGSCADIVIGEFLKRVSDGESAGDAYCKSLEVLMAGRVNAQTVKTLAEFSLFGDPSVRMRENESKSFKSSIFSQMLGSSVEKGLHVPMPDIRRSTKLALAQVDVRSMMAQAVNNHVVGKYSFMRNVEPKFYRTSENGVFMANYSTVDVGFRKTVSVYCDERGKIIEELVSK